MKTYIVYVKNGELWREHREFHSRADAERCIESDFKEKTTSIAECTRHNYRASKWKLSVR